MQENYPLESRLKIVQPIPYYLALLDHSSPEFTEVRIAIDRLTSPPSFSSSSSRQRRHSIGMFGPRSLPCSSESPLEPLALVDLLLKTNLYCSSQLTSADNATAIPYQTCTKPRKRVGKYVNKLRAVPLCDDDYDLEEFDRNPDQDYFDYEDDYEN